MIKGRFPIPTSLPIFAQCNGSQSETSMEHCICIKQSPKMCLKSPGGAGGRNGRTERFYTIMVCLNEDILPVYPAAEGNRHFVWGHPTNIPLTGGCAGSGESCDSVFIMPQCDLLGEGGVATSEAEVEIAPVGQWRGGRKWMMELRMRWKRWSHT